MLGLMIQMVTGNQQLANDPLLGGTGTRRRVRSWDAWGRPAEAAGELGRAGGTQALGTRRWSRRRSELADPRLELSECFS